MRSLALKYDLDTLDARITASRAESKYLVTPTAARAVAAELDRQLVRHHHGSRNSVSRTNHFVTTIYFDTAERSLFQRAMESTEYNVKLRAREYYDTHPDVLESASDVRDRVGYESVVWLELKYREGARTCKRRIGIPKLELAKFFINGTITPNMMRIQGAAFGEDARRVLTEVAELCASCVGPMRADSLVNYKRQAWQDTGAQVRVTLDSALASFAPPADLWERGALVRPTLGAAVATETRHVLEVKSHGAPPSWLARVLADHRIEPALFSKFETASSAVHAADRVEAAA